ncbi:MAG: alkylation response protein AidB-like acyl-CoA dehydrogenase [Limisphaerales bacterium]
MNALVEQAQAFIPTLQQKAGETERQGKVSPEIVSALRDKGLLNLLSPARHGGGETDFTTAFQVAATLARGCMSTGWVATVGNVHNWMATGLTQECQTAYFADENVFSSASFAPTGTAKMTADGFVANGTWGFLSGVDHAQWAFVTAIVSESIDGRNPGPWFLMVPVADIKVHDDSWHVTGMAGTGSKSVTLADTFVPLERAVELAEFMAGRGPGVGSHEGNLYGAPFRPVLVAVLAAPILGAAQAAVEHFTEYTRKRVVKMTGGQQAQDAMSQATVAEVSATVHAAQLILQAIFNRLDDPAPLSPEEQAQIPRDTSYAVKLLVEAVNKIIANAGGTAAQLDNPLQRIWRDVQVASNHAAVNFSTNMQSWGASVLTK